MVLREAWKKKIKVGASFIYFGHDYPSEIVKKHKEYTAIKKLLKEKNIRFQTPFVNMIHWESGTHTYKCTQDVYSELRRCRFQVGSQKRMTSRMQRRDFESFWTDIQRKATAAAMRAKAKLQGFQRRSSHFVLTRNLLSTPFWLHFILQPGGRVSSPCSYTLDFSCI